jgi:hypothetical protein
MRWLVPLSGHCKQGIKKCFLSIEACDQPHVSCPYASPAALKMQNVELKGNRLICEQPVVPDDR